MDDNTSFPTSGQTNSPQPIPSAGGVPPVAPVVPLAPQPVSSQSVPNQSFTPPPSTQVQMPPQEVVMSQSQSSVPLQTTLSPGASIQMPPEQSPVIEQPVPVASPQQVFQQVPQAPVGPSSDMPQPMPAASVPSEAVSASLPEEKHIPDLTAASQILQTSSIGRERVSLTPPVSPPQQIPSDAPANKEKKKGFSFPKPLRLGFTGIIILFLLFLTWRIMSGFFGGTTNSSVTLTYWGLWEDSNIMQSVISDFERQNPQIQVNYVKQDPQDYSKTLLARIQNGTGPDVFRYHVSWLPMVLPSLAPLSTDAITKGDFAKDYFPVMQKDLIKNGAIYGVPLEVDSLSLFVNKTIFDGEKAEVPTTWDSFITTARALTTRDASGKIQVAGAALGTYDNITHAPDIISLLLIQNGVNLTTMTPASNASDALTFYTSFANEQGNVWDSTLDPSLLAFERGKLAMYLGYSWDAFSIKAADPNLSFAIYPVPHLPGRNSTIVSYWVEGVSAKSAHQKEAMAFMKFLSQKDTLTKLYTAEAKTRQFGEPYPRPDLVDTLKSDPMVYPFASQAVDAQSSFFAGETKDTGINAQMNGYLGNAVNSMLQNTSADSAVETLTKGVSQILNQYGQQ